MILGLLLAMKIERQKVIDSPRDFKVLHQTLCINSIDFETRNLFGYTEFSILPLVTNLRSIRLNCSKQCRINRVTVQEAIDAAFIHDDPFSALCEDSLSGKDQTRSFSSLAVTLQTCADKCDADKNGGNLLIKFPYEIYSLADEQKLIRIGVEFNVEKPTSGLKFVFHPQLEGASWREKASHVYTCREPGHSLGHSSWFPCVDAYSELCAWKIEVSLDTALTAVCSGELQGVSYSSDLRKKNFVYSLNIPTPACNIGICIGVFDIFVHPDMNELSAFCPPQLLPLLKLTCQNLHKVFEFFEELLSSRYPYGSMKVCFVDDLPILDIHSSALSYSTLILLNVKCLYHKKIIDQVPLTRRAIAFGLASQFFGCYLVQRRFEDSWVCYGLASYLANMYCQKAFGNNEYMYQIYEDINQLVEYESKCGPVVLNEYREEESKAEIKKPFSPFTARPALCSPLYRQMYAKKSFLVLRILEKKLGKELLLQVMNKLLSVCAHSVQQRLTPSVWQTGILLSTDSFLKCVSNVTGHDLQSFIDQWVKQGGHTEFVINFNFNRKRNSVELDIKQDLSGVGSSRYIGPLSVTIQELDGSFTYTIQVDDVSCRHDIQCHSKARRQRKRRIPLWTGEEVDMDLANLDPDSPLLWIRFDPELLTLSRIACHQPDYQWQYQLKHERDVVAQLQALRILPRYPTPQTRLALMETIRNEQCFYRVRCESCFALADVANRLFSMMTGVPSIVTIFNSIFGSKSSSEIPRLNNFSNFQQYFLAKALISSAALIRTTTTVGSLSSSDYRCPPEVQQFLMNVCKLNNNSQNKFADDLYRSNIYEALGKTALKLRRDDHSTVSSRRIDPDVDMRVQFAALLLQKFFKNITKELVHALNMEKIKPSYGKCISSSCLKALTDIWKSGYISERQAIDDSQMESYSNFQFWWNFVEIESFLPSRLIALECIVDYLLCCKRVDFFDIQSGKIKSPCFYKFLDFLSKDEGNFQPFLRTYCLYNLLYRITFDNRSRSTFVDSTGLIFRSKLFFDRCSRILIENLSHDSLTKSILLDLMLNLFGKEEPCFTTDGFVVGCTDMDKDGVGGRGSVIREDAGFSLANDDLILTPVTL